MGDMNSLLTSDEMMKNQVAMIIQADVAGCEWCVMAGNCVGTY